MISSRLASSAHPGVFSAKAAVFGSVFDFALLIWSFTTDNRASIGCQLGMLFNIFLQQLTSWYLLRQATAIMTTLFSTFNVTRQGTHLYSVRANHAQQLTNRSFIDIDSVIKSFAVLRRAMGLSTSNR